jgi:MFS family permease
VRQEQVAVGVGTGRGRALAVLVVGAAMTQAAVVVAATAGTVMFATAFGDRWGTVPGTAIVVGAATGTIGLARLMLRTGRRPGMIAAYTVAAVGGGLALVGPPVLVVVGLFLTGCGSAGSQSARYAAAELYPPARRGFALGAVVWAGTVGGVGGPAVLGPAADLAVRFGLPGPTGALLLAFAATAIAAVVTTGLPRTAPRPAPAPVRRPGPGRTTVTVRTAMVAMMAAQGAMVAIMVAAPLHLHHHGYDLGAVGTVIGVHTLGMFAFAPLSGYLTDRYGDRRALLAGLGLVGGSAFMLVSATDPAGIWLPVALFLLGYGWNLAMVAGSALLVTRVPQGDRIRVQGGVDARVWCVTALATLSSSQLFALGGYTTLAAMSVAPVLVATAYVARRASSEGGNDS